MSGLSTKNQKITVFSAETTQKAQNLGFRAIYSAAFRIASISLAETKPSEINLNLPFVPMKNADGRALVNLYGLGNLLEPAKTG